MTQDFLVYDLASEALAAQDEIWTLSCGVGVKDDVAEVTRRWAIPRQRNGGDWVFQAHPTVSPVANPPKAIEPWDPAWFEPPGTWSATDKSPGIVLANSDRDASNTVLNNYSIVRGSKGRLTGKFYFEVVHTFLGGHASPVAGLADPSAVLADGDYLGKLANQFGITSTTAYGAGMTVDKLGGLGEPGWRYTAGGIAGFAVDLDARKVWVALNNIWLGLGNPAAGTNWFAHWDTPVALYPAASLFFSITSDVVRYCGDASDQNFAPPAGFTAWDLE